MRDIAIYGAGGLGKEVACLIGRINSASKKPIWNLIGFFDDGISIGTSVSHFGKVIGGLDTIESWDQELDLVLAFGSPKILSTISSKIKNSKINYPNIIDPSFRINDPQTFSIGHGNVIQNGCAASCDVTIGCFNLFNGSVVLGHDASIGDCNVLMPGTRISGEVSIENKNLFGVYSVVLQQLKVGHGITLAAGSILMTKPKDNSVYMGIPAKIFKH